MEQFSTKRTNTGEISRGEPLNQVPSEQTVCLGIQESRDMLRGFLDRPPRREYFSGSLAREESVEGVALIFSDGSRVELEGSATYESFDGRQHRSEDDADPIAEQVARIIEDRKEEPVSIEVMRERYEGDECVSSERGTVPFADARAFLADAL